MTKAPISIGMMRQTGSFMKNNPTADTTGGQFDSYTVVCTCRGRLEQMRANKSLEQGEIVQNKSFEWICRYQAAIVLDADSAWQIGAQFYRITSWELIDQIPHWYRFVLNLWQ